MNSSTEFGQIEGTKIMVPVSEKLPSEYTELELVESHDKLDLMIKQFEAAKTILREELLLRLQAEKKNGKIIGNFAVSIRKRVSFKTKLAEAEALGCTTMSVDTAKLKDLYNNGAQIPGVQVTEYVIVDEVKKSGD